MSRSAATVYYLYRAFDDEGTLLYVGSTADWRRRLARHRRFSDWWRCLGTIDVDIIVGCPSARDAIRAEAEVIRTERPVLNVLYQPIIPGAPSRPAPPCIAALDESPEPDDPEPRPKAEIDRAWRAEHDAGTALLRRVKNGL